MFSQLITPLNFLEKAQTFNAKRFFIDYEININNYSNCNFIEPLEIIDNYLCAYFQNNEPKQIFYFPTSFEFESDFLLELIQFIDDGSYLICYDNFWILIKDKKKLENTIDLNLNLGYEVRFFVCLNNQSIISNTSHGTFTNF